MIHLLNTAIIPADADGHYHITKIGVEDARAMCDGADLVSHIGHASTAALASTLLGVEVEVDRSQWDGTDLALVIQLTFRGEEGRIYTQEEMEGFLAEGKIVLRLMYRDMPFPRS